MKTQKGNSAFVITTWLLLLSVMVIATQGAGLASAANARFTSLTASYVGLDDDYYHDWDFHADDLELTFTEVGIGNGKDMDITVSASREINATCISALGEFDMSSDEVVPIEFSDGESPGDQSLSYSPEDAGRLTGTVQIKTHVETDVCPVYDPRSEDHGVVVYMLKDYSLTYVDITATDHKNAISTSIARAEPGYSYEGYGLNLAVGMGFSQSLHCGLHEDAGGAHCHFGQ